jgi:hypothetical protein
MAPWVRVREAMITFADILLLMLAYAGLSLSGVCLIWHMSSADTEPFLYELPA